MHNWSRFFKFICLSFICERMFIMTKIKKIMSCFLISAISVTSLAMSASADRATANLYQNQGGGPAKLLETVSIYKNEGDSYYAECNEISFGSVNVKGENNVPNKKINFTSEGYIDFEATTDATTFITFKVTWTPRTYKTGSASVTIGWYNIEKG